MTLWQGIVKVQRSLATSMPGEQCLIYNEGRTIWMQQMMPENLKLMFQGGEAKFYAFAKWENGTLTIERRAEPQPW